MPLGRRLLYAAMMVVGVLGLTELAARVVGGRPLTRVVIRMPDGSPGALYRTEADGSLRPTDAGLLSWWPRELRSPPGGRVVWLGGSSVAGAPAEAIAARFVGDALEVETVDLAMGGADTGHLLGLLPLVDALSPEVVVIYTGHNDLGNALFARYYADPASVRVARIRQVLGRSAFYGLVERALGTRSVARVVNPTYSHPEETLPPDERAAAMADYEARLRELVVGAQASGAQVVLSTVVSNPRWPSAIADCPDRVRAVGVEPVRMGEPPLQKLDRDALARERAAGDCWYLDFVHALDRFDQAGDPAPLLAVRDADPAPLRAVTGSNAIVAAVARETGARLVDTAAAFRARGGGVEPHGWFYDNVHLNETGHQALAAALAPAVAHALGREATLPWPTTQPDAETPRRGPPPAPR